MNQPSSQLESAKPPPLSILTSIPTTTTPTTTNTAMSTPPARAGILRDRRAGGGSGSRSPQPQSQQHHAVSFDPSAVELRQAIAEATASSGSNSLQTPSPTPVRHPMHLQMPSLSEVQTARSTRRRTSLPASSILAGGGGTVMQGRSNVSVIDSGSL